MVSDILSGIQAEETMADKNATFPLKNILTITTCVDMDKIKIPRYLKQSIPSGEKIAARVNEYKANKRFNTEVRVSEDGTLEDGYTAYLVAKMLGLDRIPITINA